LENVWHKQKGEVMETKGTTLKVYSKGSVEESSQGLVPWECVVEKGQTFVCDSKDDKGMFEVVEVNPVFKFDADVTLLKKADYSKRHVKASSLCSNPFWRRLPDLELDEVYLSDDVDPFDAPTRIGLGPGLTLPR
jgi:hypothetical protein